MQNLPGSMKNIQKVYTQRNTEFTPQYSLSKNGTNLSITIYF